MSGATISIRWSWPKLFSYGEVVCFVSAWAIGLLMAIEGQRPDQTRTATRTFAASGDTLGMQAKLLR
jgi:hypothetical protein